LLYTFWDNCWDPPLNLAGKKLIPQKKNHWKDLEWIGDAHLMLQARLKLRWICGEENWNVLTVLEEHAKGNPFFAQVGKYFKLDEWVRISPSHPKDWADLAEAWIGAVVKERFLYDETDPLEELNSFLYRLWIIRYRDLKEYFIGAARLLNNEDVEVEILHKREVKVPGDALMRDVIDSSATARTIGFQFHVRITSKPGRPEDSVVAKGFGLTANEAEEIAIHNAVSTKRGNRVSIKLKPRE
jgi:dsRNA-specific ribonuclease